MRAEDFPFFAAVFTIQKLEFQCNLPVSYQSFLINPAAFIFVYRRQQPCTLENVQSKTSDLEYPTKEEFASSGEKNTEPGKA